MSTSFQPEKPGGEVRHPAGAASVVWPAVLGGLLVFMLFALAVPRLTGSDEANWALALGAGVLTLLVVLGVGLLRRR